MLVAKKFIETTTMQGEPKKAKMSGQFSGFAGPRTTLMVPTNFGDTTDQVGISWPHKWYEIYNFVVVAKICDKTLPMEVRDSDEDVSDIDVYYQELLKVKMSEIYKITSRPVALPITDVMQWITTHVDFRRMVVVADDSHA